MKDLTVNGEKIVNVPNLLSLYRLLISPYILYLALTGQENLYAVFICISLISDVLDGNIARFFRLQTRFGASLDNIADIFTYVLAFIGIFTFKAEEMMTVIVPFSIFLGVLILSYIVAFARFKKVPGMHLYLAVSSGYAQGIFIFVLFAFGFKEWLFYFSIILGIIAYTEKIIILFKIKEIRSGIKGLYWVLKDKKR